MFAFTFNVFIQFSRCTSKKLSSAPWFLEKQPRLFEFLFLSPKTASRFPGTPLESSFNYKTKVKLFSCPIPNISKKHSPLGRGFLILTMLGFVNFLSAQYEQHDRSLLSLAVK